MSPAAKRLIKNWAAGAVVGTLLIAVTSPLFVRSYLPDQFDEARQVSVPSPNANYRWRSEGYATTRIGPHGMPGRRELPDETLTRIALWGDSQAEGVCVADDEKLFAKLNVPNLAAVLPLARSGDDLHDWLKQIPAVEKNLGVDAHVLLIVDLSDLHSAQTDDSHEMPSAANHDFQSSIAKYMPAFAIQGVRNLMTDNTGNARQLRFGVGPVTSFCAVPVDEKDVQGVQQRELIDWDQPLGLLRGATRKPIAIVYAPKSIAAKQDSDLPPSIGEIPRDTDQMEIGRLASSASSHRIIFHDASEALARLAKNGTPPHGFHNGQIGQGHFNAAGYQAIAGEIKPIVANIVEPQE